MVHAVSEVSETQDAPRALYRLWVLLAVLLLIAIGVTAAITARVTSNPSNVPPLYGIWRSDMVEVASLGGELPQHASHRALMQGSVAMYGVNARGGGVAVGMTYAVSETSEAAMASSYLGQINDDLNLALQLMATGTGRVSQAQVTYVVHVTRSVVAALPRTITSEEQLGTLAPRIITLQQSVHQQLVQRGL